jgi:hypothetical protein
VDDDSEGDLERRDAPGLALGVGGAANLGTTRQKSTTGSTYADGTATYLHGAADLVFKWRGVYVLAEGVVRAATEDAVVAEDGTEQPTRSGWGWFVQPAVMVAPRGEVAARYSELHPFEGTDPAFEPVNELGAGTNLYLNGHRFKVQLGWTALYEATPATAQHLVNLQVDTMF